MTDTTATPTPYIAVSTNFYACGSTAQTARKALVQAGGSPQEPQIVYKLPEGATDAFVSTKGDIHWSGSLGEATPVFNYVGGKAVALKPDQKPQAYKAPTKNTKPRHPKDAQDTGERSPEPELGEPGKDDAETTDAVPAQEPAKARKRPAKKPASALEAEPATEPTVAAPSRKKPAPKPVQVAEVPVPVGGLASNEAAQIEAASAKPIDPTLVAAAVPSDIAVARARRNKKQSPPPAVAESTPTVAPAEPPAPEPELEEARTDPETGHEVIGAADEDGVARSTPANFLLFVGSHFYSKDSFVKESATLGISRRMPSHRLPKDLKCGVSRIYVAAEGARKTDGTPSSTVFGWFVPQRVDFIRNESQEFATIVAALSTREDVRIIDDSSLEPERECGHRQTGGTYVVVDKGDSPLMLLEKPANYVGNHFRGLLRLTAGQSAIFDSGETVATLIDEVCMKCGAAMKCAPDGHNRAVRERKRIDRGELPKWYLQCADCQRRTREEARAARDAADGTPVEPTQEESADQA